MGCIIGTHLQEHNTYLLQLLNLTVGYWQLAEDSVSENSVCSNTVPLLKVMHPLIDR